MKRKFFFAFSIAAALLVLDAGVAYSQDKKQEQGQTCEEFIAKPLTDEQLKKLSEKDRKEYESEFKRCKEAIAGNEKARNANAIVNRVLKEGATAMGEKNYDVAIVKYDEGYTADTEFWGSAPVMLRNKAIALRARGIDKYNTANKNPDRAARAPGVADAGKDFQASVDALQKALDILGKSTVPTNAAEAKNFADYKTAVITERAESYRLLVKVDSSKAADGVKAYEEYIAIETDPTKKSKAQFTAADLALESGNADLAVTEFQKIVQQDPANSKALYKLGIALISQAANENNDKVKIQEGVNYLQKFVDSAPDTDTDKEYAKATIEAMKAEQNVTPQKGAGKPAAKRKS